MKKFLMILALTFSVASASGGYLEYKKCAGCHGDNGEKQALGKSVAIGGQDVNLTKGQLFGYRNGKLNKYGMGALMKGQVMNMSGEEIQLLSEYIERLGKMEIANLDMNITEM